jgi:hypothetical protein
MMACRATTTEPSARIKSRRAPEVCRALARGDLRGLVGVAAMPRKDQNVPRVVCPEKRG